MDDGDPIGEGLSPDGHDADLGPDGGADAGGDDAPLGASTLDPQTTGGLDGDPLDDPWATESDDGPMHPDADGQQDLGSGDSTAVPDLADEDGPAGDNDAPAPDTDGPHVDAGTPVGADHANRADDAIHFDIDDAATDPDDQPATDPDDQPDVRAAPLLGLTPPEVTEHSLAALGVVPADFGAALTRMGVSDPECGLDGRTVGIAMGEVGVDAVVEHAGLDDLADLVGEGRQVLLTGPPDAPVLQLTDIDIAGGSCVVEDVATGARHVIGLDAVESSWAASGYQVVTGSAAAPVSDAAGRGGASVAVVQAVIAAWQ